MKTRVPFPTKGIPDRNSLGRSARHFMFKNLGPPKGGPLRRASMKAFKKYNYWLIIGALDLQVCVAKRVSKRRDGA
jgi:hypothetical protein